MTEYDYNPVLSPLQDAAAIGDVDRVRALIAAGFDVNAEDCEGDSPLHLAIEHGHDEVAAVLLAAHANPNASSGPFLVPLHSSKTAAQVRMLVEAGAWLDSEDDCGHQPLYYSQSVEHALSMIDAGAEVVDEAWADSEFVRKAYALHVCGGQQKRFDVPAVGYPPRRRA